MLRIAILFFVAGLASAQTRISPQQLPNSDIVPVSTVTGYVGIKCWGDSLTQGTGTTGGYILYPIVQVTSNSMCVQLGQLLGVPVSVTAQLGITSDRVASYCTNDTTRAVWLNIIWGGTNDQAAGIPYATTIANLEKCIATLTGPYLVLSPLNENVEPATLAPSGSAYTSYYQPLQPAEAAAFGSHFADVWQALINASCSATGPYYDAVACTGRAAPNGGSGNPTLVYAGPHLNNLGYGFVANFLAGIVQSMWGGGVPSVQTVNQMIYQSGSIGNVCVGGGTANAQSATCTPALPDAHDGSQVCFTPVAQNTGPATFYLDGTLAGTYPIPVVKYGAGGPVVLAGGEFLPTAKACLILNATVTPPAGQGPGQWEFQNPQASH